MRDGFLRATHGTCVRASLFLSLCVAPGCDTQPETPEVTDPAPAEAEVTTVEVAEDGWTEAFVAYGVVEPATSVVITAPLTGRVEAVLVAEGDTVEAGQALVRFDEGTRRTQLRQAKSNSAAAKKAVADARREADERTALGRAGTMARTEVEAAEIALRQAVERYEDARSTVRLASRDVEDMKIESPVAGTVTARSIEPGEAVSAGREFFTISTTDRLRVKVFVSEVHVNALALGATVPVAVNGVRGTSMSGRVESVALNADEGTGNFEVMIALDDPSGLVRPGMTARASLASIPDADAIVIPRAAVVDRDRKRVVFVERDGVAHELHAVLGIGGDAFIPVLEGLEPGDHVIVDGLAFVQDGVSVKATLVDMPPRPGVAVSDTAVAPEPEAQPEPGSEEPADATP